MPFKNMLNLGRSNHPQTGLKPQARPQPQDMSEDRRESQTRQDPEPASTAQIVLNKIPAPGVWVASGMSAEEVTCSDGSKVVRIGSGDAAALPGGLPGGLAVLVPESFEKAVSGKKVRVTLMARAASGARSADFSMSYSTNEVGNSGWVKQTAGPRFESKSLEWPVPPMKGGFGDFVGILPAPRGQCGVEIAWVKAEVVAAD